MLAVSMASSSTAFAPAPKRPKLSLQTDSLAGGFVCHPQSFTPILVSATAATPTSSNTFNNTYDLTHRPSPLATSNPGKTFHAALVQSPRPSRRADRTYHLPYGVKSILKNSEIHNYSTASPLTSSRKVLFPQPKRVCFAKDPDEEIVTKVYTARHSDLVWDFDEADVIESVENQNGEVPEACADSENTSHTMTATQTIQMSRRDSGVCFSSTEITTSAATTKPPTIPATFQSRKKRRWEWTLSPLRPRSVKDDKLRTRSSISEQESCSGSRQDHSVEPSTGEIEVATVETRPPKRRAASVDVSEEASEGTADSSRAPARPRRRAKRSNTL